MVRKVERGGALMTNYFEIDFLSVETKKSGDAITIRYEIDGESRVHVVDGGFQATGPSIVAHIKKYYDAVSYIDHVVVTHADGDHAGGLRTVLEEMDVGALWMLRPWMYAAELINRFETYSSVEHLARRLKAIYWNLAALEEIALRRGIPIYEPFQGQQIGEFIVLAPTKNRYLDLVVESEKTPEAADEDDSTRAKVTSFVESAFSKVVNLIKGAWGEEVFSTQETSAENEMSVVQYANLCGKRILLTGDAGRAALTEAADYAPLAGLYLPGIDRMQVPHHGSRKNVSTELLDRWLGTRLPVKPAPGNETFTAVVSSALEDKDHPRKSVVRAFQHRGAKFLATEGNSIRVGHNAPARAGWSTATALAYPEDQEA